jgi:hypothetical protein
MAVVDAAIRARIGTALASACWWSWVTSKDETPRDTWWAE